MKKCIGADPYVLYDIKSGNYYCYATSNEPNKNQFYLYKSSDLLHWSYLGYALDLSKNNWSKDWYWAPECYYNPNNGYYYLFYSARVKDELTEEYFGRLDYLESAKIGVAVSKSPEGPFFNINDRPMDYYPFDYDNLNVEDVYEDYFKQGIDLSRLKHNVHGTYVSAIDANVLFEEERMYLFFSRCCYKSANYDLEFKKFIEESTVSVVELNTDWWYAQNADVMPTVKEEFKKVINGKRQDLYTQVINYSNEPQAWENGHVYDYEQSNGKMPNRRWTEGSTSFVVEFDGEKTYGLIYSCNNFESPLYGVGIAFADKVEGPYKKYKDNPIIHEKPEESLYSTGHGCIVEKDGKQYYVFHGRCAVTSDRVLYRGELHINEKDDIKVDNIVVCELKETTDDIIKDNEIGARV